MADEVQFTLPDPDYERVLWVHNEHFVGSITPLELTLRDQREQRLNEDGLPNSIYINGYGYGREPQIRESTTEPDETIVLGWREHRLPLVETVCAELESFEVGSVQPGAWRETLVAQDERFWAAFGGVHRDTMGQVFPASARWVALYTARFGDSAREDALAMLGGYPNASSARAAALWDLGRIAASDPTLLSVIDAGQLPEPRNADEPSASERHDREPVAPPPLAGEGRVGVPAHDAFLQQWDALIKRFGYTTTTHLVDLPTWREDPAIPLGMIAAMARDPQERNPRLAEIAAAQRRLILEGALERLDDGTDPQLALLRRVHHVARHLAPASEDHNLLCDQRMIAAARVKWLRIGTHLVVRRVLASEHDIFYLTVDELLAALEHGDTVAADEIARRREQQARWRAVTPPARLGAVSQAHETPLDGASSAGLELRGVAASAGVYRGRARIVAALPDAHRLQPGEVLVCAATSPEWTPFFSVAGALVAGTGSLLAHAAVVAREFGIPAVVGAAGATTLIHDGDLVTVDGSKGTVSVE